MTDVPDRAYRRVNWVTAGEWMIGEEGANDGEYPIPGTQYDGTIISITSPDGPDWSVGEIANVNHEADARMMAASKDLYAQLGRAITMLRAKMRPDEYTWLRDMEAAMDKATGWNSLGRAPVTPMPSTAPERVD